MLNNIYKSLIILALLGALNLKANQAGLTKHFTEVSPSKVAPSLKLEDTEEEIINIEDLKGKVVIVNFWATWCPPCRKEMGSLERLYSGLKDKGVVVLAVNVGEDEDPVLSFMNDVEPPLTFNVLYDKDSKTMQKWGAIGLPSTFVVDKKGDIVYKAIGGRDFDDKNILDKIISLLK
ncbi:TlpA disulfide reductase family protein [Sulfurimonas sp.]|uniref:TlpA family protein disulfide reductase n=1 Tax=Sulfurimonas sp. TaxID=2022749 RepID=UPI0025D9665A|nr:TlpA disulfide reductase family protein [Sulfurimonas sp.]MCK9454076.1 TlpA family protein disulfide reductase [Sulfurimonas sp.]